MTRPAFVTKTAAERDLLNTHRRLTPHLRRMLEQWARVCRMLMPSPVPRRRKGGSR